MYSWVRYGIAIYLGLALAGAVKAPIAQGDRGTESLVRPARQQPGWASARTPAVDHAPAPPRRGLDGEGGPP
jgi:hypothetical protein